MTDPTSGAPVTAGVPGPPPPMPPSMGSDPHKPGSKAWVEQRFGPTATFVERIVPNLIDAFLSFAGAIVLIIPGVALIVAGIPDSYDCGYANPDYGCQVPGSGSGEQIFFGIVLLFLSVFVAWGLTVWNRVWRVHKTGQSVGRKMMGLRVINAHTGTHPEFGSAVLRELVHQFAGIISWIWMLVDDDDRTLADIVGTTHVIRTGTR